MLVKLSRLSEQTLTITVRHTSASECLFRRFSEPIMETPNIAFLRAVHRAMRWAGVQKFEVVNILPGLNHKSDQADVSLNTDGDVTCSVLGVTAA